MADHGTTLKKLIAGRKVSSGTTESRVDKFKGDLNKFKDNPGQGVRSLLSGMFGGDAKKGNAPKNIIGRMVSGALNNIKRPPRGSAAPKAASTSAPATETRTPGRGGGPGRANQNPEGNHDQKRITTAVKRPTMPNRKPVAAKVTETSKMNAAAAARRKQRRKSSDSKYNEGPGGKFNFAGAISRQLIGR